ncbi:MAG: type II toxin-antitoxin system HicB family antitoxin [Candidatus Aenigmarchaeota archaeon]|nr:type II toxin-antitoxin system HicB family antitoxin [Candidatus Aenigmarchaeota archaeon]MCK5177824.1 type II toxin-antitoxin system HicB family antitoxin [Candidatus Aenigmarchaeota archaeon]
MANYRLPVVVEKDKDGYFAFCYSLQGCNVQGETYEEVLENIRDAMKLHIEDIWKEGETIGLPCTTNLIQVEEEVIEKDLQLKKLLFFSITDEIRMNLEKKGIEEKEILDDFVKFL